MKNKIKWRLLIIMSDFLSFSLYKCCQLIRLMEFIYFLISKCFTFFKWSCLFYATLFLLKSSNDQKCYFKYAWLKIGTIIFSWNGTAAVKAIILILQDSVLTVFLVISLTIEVNILIFIYNYFRTKGCSVNTQ